MLSGRDSGFLPSSKDTQQHSLTESSAAAPADNNKPGEASHKERREETEDGRMGQNRKKIYKKMREERENRHGREIE